MGLASVGGLTQAFFCTRNMLYHYLIICSEIIMACSQIMPVFFNTSSVHRCTPALMDLQGQDIVFNMRRCIQQSANYLHTETHEGILKMLTQDTCISPSYKHSQLGKRAQDTHTQTCAHTYTCIPKCNACSLSMHN